MLIELGYDKAAPDEFLFSTGFKPGNTVASSLRTRAQEIWRKEVIQGLGINKKMYGLKRTSGQLYLSRNEVVDASWLQRQMEHSSLEETEAYISSRKLKRIDESKINVGGY